MMRDVSTVCATREIWLSTRVNVFDFEEKLREAWDTMNFTFFLYV